MSILYTAIVRLLEVAEFAIFIRVILSWLPISRENSLIRILYQLTEPILGPIRGLIERSAFGRNMMVDFSPVIAFILIDVIKNVLANLLGVGRLVF